MSGEFQESISYKQPVRWVDQGGGIYTFNWTTGLILSDPKITTRQEDRTVIFRSPDALLAGQILEQQNVLPTFLLLHYWKAYWTIEASDLDQDNLRLTSYDATRSDAQLRAMRGAFSFHFPRSPLIWRVKLAMEWDTNEGDLHRLTIAARIFPSKPTRIYKEPKPLPGLGGRA